MSREASGFPCPVCEHQQADILSMKLPQLELRCQECGWEYAVET